ncbi:poly-beta-hydroxybutyrate polymerase [Janthinobacterium sp. HH103]|uniref:Alpha/beta fold hydrolase n=1 Tax=Janthinobacterium agaricidamnosum TaxID=55508 RepID=A0A3G2E8W9_9BURK|nr:MULTISPECIES: alpha/beta fold hydrolase [Janthinobacterium]AYM76260.1 alpha/beta fold hydrolase [Janthinobacterium agaricidamnosum]OEZ64274.1 poly-beta-hydroxybutyrate polymerase [Janthinobacterium sp. HH100]OEZ89027.1 poly-beta-hydroxybutyrate polymerase [Janthinobacterium sp. HH103]QOU73436.1 Poly(3-hydroxyalkanoate) polymerase subunit PhaC [Janthinobacterium sp. HH102]
MSKTQPSDAQHNVEHERLGSAWQGVPAPDYPESAPEGATLDLLLNAWLGKFTGGISPAALGNAYADWLSHLALAPSKQQALLQEAWKKIGRWQQYAMQSAIAGGAAEPPCIAPLPQDRRFEDPAWRRWPYNLVYQGFLLQQQWWHRATTGVRGVAPHHEDVVTFTVRQWLDMLAPSNFLLTNPVVQQATLASGGANLTRGMIHAAEDWQRAAMGAHAPDRRTYKVGVNVAVTPGKVVYRNDLIELIQYAPATARVHATPLLFVPAWIMKFYILDLSPHNSLVRYLVGQGHTVFMISWKNPLEEDRELSLEDYRQLGVMEALDAVIRITGAPQVHAAGYCLGGTLLAIAAATMARDGDMRLASLTMLASQVDFKEPGELSLFIDESQVSFLEAAMWKQGYLDTKQMAGAFQLLRSNDLIWSRQLRHYLLGLDEQDSDLMAWNADATRMPCRMHSEYLRRLFLHNDLAEGRYRTAGRHIALPDIKAPVFAVGTLTDHVAPWRSVYKLQLLTDTDVTFLLTSGGHNAGVVSPPGQPHRSYQLATHRHDAPYIDADSWQREVAHHDGSWWPAWQAWLAERPGAQAAPPAMGPDLGDAPGSYVLQT